MDNTTIISLRLNNEAMADLVLEYLSYTFPRVIVKLAPVGHIVMVYRYSTHIASIEVCDLLVVRMLGVYGQAEISHNNLENPSYDPSETLAQIKNYIVRHFDDTRKFMRWTNVRML